MPAGSREVRSEAKRRRVIDAAQDLFLENGLQRSTMEAIALAAHVSKPTLYRYFPDKQALFVGVLEHLATDPLDEGELAALQDVAIESQEDLERVLTSWAEKVLARTMQPAYLGLIRLLIAEVPRIPELGRLFQEAIPQHGAAYLVRILENARQREVVVVDDTDAALRLIVGPLLLEEMAGLFSPSRPSPPSRERIATLVRLTVRALTRRGK
jgi:TetR/AcrR family transcriptional regulator, mexJK operon transcriptional repressor